MWSELTKKLKMQSDDPNVLGTSGDDRPNQTTYLGIATVPPGGTYPAPKSVLTDTTYDPGSVGADAATPGHGQSLRDLRAEPRTASSADTGHVDPAGST